MPYFKSGDNSGTAKPNSAQAMSNAKPNSENAGRLSRMDQSEHKYYKHGSSHGSKMKGSKYA